MQHWCGPSGTCTTQEGFATEAMQSSVALQIRGGRGWGRGEGRPNSSRIATLTLPECCNLEDHQAHHQPSRQAPLQYRVISCWLRCSYITTQQRSQQEMGMHWPSKPPEAHHLPPLQGNPTPCTCRRAHDAPLLLHRTPYTVSPPDAGRKRPRSPPLLTQFERAAVMLFTPNKNLPRPLHYSSTNTHA